MSVPDAGRPLRRDVLLGGFRVDDFVEANRTEWDGRCYELLDGMLPVSRHRTSGTRKWPYSFTVRLRGGVPVGVARGGRAVRMAGVGGGRRCGRTCLWLGVRICLRWGTLGDKGPPL